MTDEEMERRTQIVQPGNEQQLVDELFPEWVADNSTEDRKKRPRWKKVKLGVLLEFLVYEWGDWQIYRYFDKWETSHKSLGGRVRTFDTLNEAKLFCENYSDTSRGGE